MELLEQLTDEFIQIYERSPARLKSKVHLKDLSASNKSVCISTDYLKRIIFITPISYYYY